MTQPPTPAAAPYDLRADHLHDPMGVGAAPVRLSWRLPAGSQRQHAYRIVAGDWDSGRVESDASLFVPADITPRSGLMVEWRVKTWTDIGESSWSGPARWEYGLLTDADWNADWIAPVEAADTPARQRPAYQLAGAITIDGDVATARLYATAHGIYETFIRGERVGDLELTPGWTAYRARLQVQTYDVSQLLQPGINVVGALLSDGWWRGQNGVNRRIDDYGPTTAFLAQLVVTLTSGQTLTWGTDGSWRSTASHIIAADLIAGEVHDLRRRRAWEEWPSWSPVRVENHGTERLVASPAPPVRRITQLRPASVREIRRGCHVVDVGQNVNGWVRLHRLGSSGRDVTLTYGESLDQDGDVTQEAVAFSSLGGPRPDVTFQVDRVISAGIEGDVFEPRHSTKGFQFVRVEGEDLALAADDVAAVVVHSDLDRRGGFACSDERVNGLHRIAEWSFRGNACDIPTDCPTRERAGWTGDWQIYAETAAFLYDVGGFTVKWLRDLAAEQRSDGRVTNLVPEPHPGDERSPEIWTKLEGSAGWGDAAVHVPWVTYLASGDLRLLAEQWNSARAWVDYAAGAAATGRHDSRAAGSATPAPHERFVWDTGWHFGEWLEVGERGIGALERAWTADHGAVATAYLYRSARELADMARALGRDSEATAYADLARNVGDAWRTEFFGVDGSTTPDTQATYARALAFGLVPDELRAAAAARLVQLIRAAGTHLSTGFLATPFLLPVLADTGHLDVAYELLLQDTEPSWLTMLDRGATTVWEEWDGVDTEGVAHASLNHFSKGAVIGFLHRYVAGLQLLEPGYRMFRVQPRPGGGLSWARAHHECPYGRIEVHWEHTRRGVTLDVAVPPGTEAELILPDGTRRLVSAGEHSLSSSSAQPTPQAFL